MGSGASRTRSDSSSKPVTNYLVEEKVSSQPILPNGQANSSGDSIALFTNTESDSKTPTKELCGDEVNILDSKALGKDSIPMGTGGSSFCDVKPDKTATNGGHIQLIPAATGSELSADQDSKQAESTLSNGNRNVVGREDDSEAKGSHSGMCEAKRLSPRPSPRVEADAMKLVSAQLVISAGAADKNNQSVAMNNNNNNNNDGNRSGSQSEESSYYCPRDEDNDNYDADADKDDADEDEEAVLAAIRASRLENRSDFDDDEDGDEEGDDYAYGSDGLRGYGGVGHTMGLRYGQRGIHDDDEEYDEGVGAEEGERDEEAERENDNVADLFACTAMSLGMDHEELLFNMMYFGGGGGGGGAGAASCVVEEDGEGSAEEGDNVRRERREEDEGEGDEEERDEYGYGSPAAVGRKQVGFDSGGRGGVGDADDNSSVRSSGDRSVQSGTQRFRGGNNGISMLRTMLNNTVEETIAAHSANNTGYKLKPADEVALKKLLIRKFSGVTTPQKVEGDAVVEAVAATDDVECMVCRDTVELGDEIIELTDTCGHLFHAECITRWLKMQSWCPVCRTSIASTQTTYVSPSTVMEVPSSVGKVSPRSCEVAGNNSGVGGGVCKNKPTSSGGRCGSGGSNNGAGHSPRAFAIGGTVGSSSASSVAPNGATLAATGGDNIAGAAAAAALAGALGGGYGYDEEGELDRRTLEMLHREMGGEMSGFGEEGEEGMGPEDRDSAGAAGEADASSRFHAQLAADFAAASGGLDEGEEADRAECERNAHYSAKQRAAAAMTTSAVASGGNSLRASPKHFNYDAKSVHEDER